MGQRSPLPFRGACWCRPLLNRLARSPPSGTRAETVAPIPKARRRTSRHPRLQAHRNCKNVGLVHRKLEIAPSPSPRASAQAAARKSSFRLHCAISNRSACFRRVTILSSESQQKQPTLSDPKATGVLCLASF